MSVGLRVTCGSGLPRSSGAILAAPAKIASVNILHFIGKRNPFGQKKDAGRPLNGLRA